VDQDILGGTLTFRWKKNTSLRYVVSYFLEKYPLGKFSRFGLWGVCRVILQLWKKPNLIQCPEDRVLEVLRSTQNLH
jgi:hypothetical protein